MLHLKHDSKHWDRRTAARQERLGCSSGSLAHLGKRYALLLGLLVLSLFSVVWLSGEPVAWANSPVSPVFMSRFPQSCVTMPTFWDRVRAALSWRSPLPWFLVGLLALGLLSWGLLWALSRLGSSSAKVSESDPETVGE